MKQQATCVRTNIQALTTTAENFDTDFLGDERIVSLTVKPQNSLDDIEMQGRTGDSWINIGDGLELDVDFSRAPTDYYPRFRMGAGTGNLEVIVTVSRVTTN